MVLVWREDLWRHHPKNLRILRYESGALLRQVRPSQSNWLISINSASIHSLEQRKIIHHITVMLTENLAPFDASFTGSLLFLVGDLLSPSRLSLEGRRGVAGCMYCILRPQIFVWLNYSRLHKDFMASFFSFFFFVHNYIDPNLVIITVPLTLPTRFSPLFSTHKTDAFLFFSPFKIIKPI